MALASVALGCGAEPGQEMLHGAALAPLPPELASLRARSCDNAAEAEDSSPDSIEAVRTTEREALRVAFSSTQAGWLPNRPVWLVQIRGNFTATRAPHPLGVDPARGRIMRFTTQRGLVPPGGSSWGLGNAEVDLSQLGAVTVLAQGAGACGAITGAVPQDVRVNLRGDAGIVVHDEASVRARVRSDRAILTAADYTMGGAVTSSHLVRFTDPDDCEYANELDAGQPETAHCKPLSVNRLAWLVVIRDATVPVFGPPGRRGPETYEATVAAFVDARTGEDLGAETLPP